MVLFQQNWQQLKANTGYFPNSLCMYAITNKWQSSKTELLTILVLVFALIVITWEILT